MTTKTAKNQYYAVKTTQSNVASNENNHRSKNQKNNNRDYQSRR